jgi:hypothetical protein
MPSRPKYNVRRRYTIELGWLTMREISPYYRVRLAGNLRYM